MNIKKPIVGILATPYISSNFERKQIYLNTLLINLLKRNKIEHLVIPYTLSKSQLAFVTKNIDGFIFPGSQLGNYYHTHEFKKHFETQKYLVKLSKQINKFERTHPILSICHGYENMLLIETNRSPIKKNIKDLFINVEAFNGYKTNPKFTKSGEKFRRLYNKSRKVIHNNRLAFSRKSFFKFKKLSKNIDILANSKDKHNKEFIEIIKYKRYPYYGFQAHPERNNKELLIPFINDVKSGYKKRFLSKKTHKIKKLISGKKVLCKKYKLAKKTSKRKCCFYELN